MAPAIDWTDPLLWIGLFAMMGAVYLIARVVTWLGIAVASQSWKRSLNEHWSERARRIWPARRGTAGLVILLAIPLVIVAGRGVGRIEALPPLLRFFLFGAAGWVGGLQSRLGWDRRFNPAIALTPRAGRAFWISNLAGTGVLMLSAFLFLAVAPGHGGPATAAIILAGVVWIGVYLSWVWMIVVRAAGLIRPAGDRFAAIAQAIADRMNVRPNSVVEMSLPMANAFAIFAHKTVGITDAALAVLSDEEITAVCAHELGHLSEPVWAKAMRIITGFVIGAWVGVFAAIVAVGTSISPGLFFLTASCALAICIAWLVLYSRVYRRMEVRADGLGKQFEPTPGAYARALEKLYSTNMVPVVLLKRKHKYPELYDRMVEAGCSPDYPRPSPPPAWPRRFGLLVMIAGVVAGCYALNWLASEIAKF